MLDRTGEWCFEGGCTYVSSAEVTGGEELDTDELEAMYEEPCFGMYD